MNQLDAKNITKAQPKGAKIQLVNVLVFFAGAIFCFVAAASAFQHDGVGALRYGFIAMVFSTIGLILHIIGTKLAPAPTNNKKR